MTPPRPDDHHRHILAINDDQAVLDLMRALLEDEGYRVTTLCNLDPDLGQVVALKPDLIILDYMWPQDDQGWSLLQMLRMDPATAAIPIVLCTGAVRKVEALRPHPAEMGVRVVLKPFDIEHLLAVIAEALPGPEPGAQT